MPPRDPGRTAANQPNAPRPRKLLDCKSLEAEDGPDIPYIYLNDFALTSDWPDDNGPTLNRALSTSREQGKRPVQVCRQRLTYLNIIGRMESFLNDPDWKGPPGRDMAHTGLFNLCHNGPMNKAECAYCEMKFRFRTPHEDPREYHKFMSPTCRYLKAFGDHGTKPSPLGRKRLHHSCLSLDILTRPS